MTRACDEARRALLARGRGAADTHLAVCAPCAAFAERLGAVDASLACDAAAAAAPLPAALRARILAAAFPAAQPLPRLRLVDVVLRTAAVAAVVLAAAWVSPVQAAEIAPPRIPDLRRVLDVDLRVPEIRMPTQADVPAIELGAATLPVAALALCLLAAGFALRRR